MKTFYVCSYGGCGSTYLCERLKKYGKVEHIHSRCPPDKLEYIGGPFTWKEWFNGKEIEEKNLHDFVVIYIYKNPVKSILSRFATPRHLYNIQTDQCTIEDVIQQGKDLYGIQEFFDNYTKPNPKRNYKIICVKYEELFEKQNELSELLNVGPLNLIKKETKRTINEENEKALNEIYRDLKNTMNSMSFITII